MAAAKATRRRRPKGTPPPLTARCDYCRQRIIWTVTTNGVPMPIDADPSPNGNILLSSATHTSGRPFAGVLGPRNAAGARDAGQQLRLHHRLSCPSVSSWAAQR